MELKFQFMLYIGVALVVAFMIYAIRKGRKKQDSEFTDGRKIASMEMIRNVPYYKRRMFYYRWGSRLVYFACLVGIFASCFMIARPSTTKKIPEDMYNRDIILCLDVSSSVDEQNLSLITQLKSVVSDLEGERFGIIIFNTSSTVVSPLSDDYEYTMKQLDKISSGIQARYNILRRYSYNKEDYVKLQYVEGGTLVGSEERGSSLIGDGLASTIFNFSKYDEKRTRIVIFSTDNELQGMNLIDLTEAAKMCKDEKIIVYGIGTEDMDYDDMNEMRMAVESTGGKFFLQSASGTYSQIVSEIEKLSKAKVKGKKITVVTDYPALPYIILLSSTFVMFGFAKLIKR